MFFIFSELTRAKYQEVIQNSGLFHINGEVYFIEMVKIFFIISLILFHQQQKIEEKDIVKGDLLGSGSCGYVYKMEHKPTNTLLAVKVTF